MIQKLFFAMLFLLLGCTGFNFSKEKLIGTWDAVLMTEDKDTVSYDISQVQLQFAANNTYHFNGNLKNKEAGNYHLLGKILYTTDTLENSRREKAVEIIKLNSDSLDLLMNDAGKMRVLKMVRKK